MPDSVDPALEVKPSSPVLHRPSAEEALRLTRAFYRVKSAATRAEIIAVVERYAAEA